MKALSIRQPWAYAILNFGKRIENREWRAAPRSMLGQTFLIHAAKGCTLDEWMGAAEFMRDAYAVRPWRGSSILPALAKLTRGALVGRARLAGVVHTNAGGHCSLSVGVPDCALCGRGLDGACAHRDPWAIPGTLGLLLADVEALPEPIPFKGALGFFDVPDAVLRVPS